MAQNSNPITRPPGPGDPLLDGSGGGGLTYTVRGGDTLWLIAKRLLGDGSKWRTIWEANIDVCPDPFAPPPGVEIIVATV